MYLKTDKGSNELQKLFIYKIIKKRIKIVLQTGLLGNRHYFGVHVENIHDLNIFYCVSNTKGSETSSYNLQVPLLMIIHTIYTIVIVHVILHVTYSY